MNKNTTTPGRQAMIKAGFNEVIIGNDDASFLFSMYGGIEHWASEEKKQGQPLRVLYTESGEVSMSGLFADTQVEAITLRQQEVKQELVNMHKVKIVLNDGSYSIKMVPKSTNLADIIRNALITFLGKTVTIEIIANGEKAEYTTAEIFGKERIIKPED